MVHSRNTRQGKGVGAKNPKPSRWGLISGAPLETAVENDGRRWWGGVYEVVGRRIRGGDSVGAPGSRNVRLAGVQAKNPQTSCRGSVWGWVWAPSRDGVVWAYRPPCRGNLGGRELAVSLYSVGGLVLLTLDLHPLGPLHLLSTPFFLSPSTPIPLPGAHGWVRYSPMGLMFGADLVRTTRRQSRWAEFETPIDFNPI